MAMKAIKQTGIAIASVATIALVGGFVSSSQGVLGTALAADKDEKAKSSAKKADRKPATKTTRDPIERTTGGSGGTGTGSGGGGGKK